ncbi:hypothetical protein JCM9279_001791 [Rhodotorula babjevae]
MPSPDADDKAALASTSTRAVPARPAGLSSDSLLVGLSNYDVWVIQIRAIVGADAWRVLTGELLASDPSISSTDWRCLDEYAMSSLVISCLPTVVHHFQGAPDSAAGYFKALKDAFRSTSAQGSLRLLTRFWGLALSASTPEAFDAFHKEYTATLLTIRTANIDINTLFSAHLLHALPLSMSALKTSLAVTNPTTLPLPETILGMVRNEVLASATPSAVALAAAVDDDPPPKPCPACGAMHWLRVCAKRDEYRRKRHEEKERSRVAARVATAPAAIGNVASLDLDSVLDGIGLDAWLSTARTPSRSPREVTLDSGATHSMCGDEALFSSLTRVRALPVGGVSGQNGLQVTGVGSLHMRLADGRVVKINGALLVPGIACTLLSLGQLYDLHGVTTTFGQDAILSRKSTVLASGTRLGRGLYRLDGELVAPAQDVVAGNVIGLEFSVTPRGGSGEGCTSVCNVCHCSHASRLPFPPSDRESSAPLELVHSDVLSVDTASISGRCYVVTFVDDYTRMLWTEPIALKSDVLDAFKRFKVAAELEVGHPLRRFRSNNGGKYTSTAFDAYLAEHGVQRSAAPAHSPQANGTAERVNRTIIEGLLSLLGQAGAPKHLWAEALWAFTFVKNRSPHAALDGRAPLTVWRGGPVRVDMMRVWGCRAWHVVALGRTKLDDKAIALVFVGYDLDDNAYRLYNPASNKIVRSRDTLSPEHNLVVLPHRTAAAKPAPAGALPVPADPHTPARLVPSRSAPGAPARARTIVEPRTPAPPRPFRESAPSPQPKVESPPPPPVPPPPPPREFRKPAPPPQPKNEDPDELDFLSNPFGATLAQVEALVAASADELGASDDAFLLPLSDPCNHREAVRDQDSEHWRAGEAEEFTSLRDNFKVYHAVDRSDVPPGAKILGAHFVYRRKKDQHGRVTGYKVRLVAQGFSQRPGVDFCETFAPVAKFTSIRVLLALAARNSSLIHQADVDKAYLHGALDEELYMRVPEGVDDASLAGKVLKLDRALYGLKQAGRVWNHRIHATLARLGYERTRSDACVYVRRDDGQLHYIALYVDDLLFVSPSSAEITRVKDGLKDEYGIKDLGEAKFILGIQIHRRADGLVFLSQRAYVEDVLARLDQSGVRTAPTPMIPNTQLRAAPLDHSPSSLFRRRYLQAVGSLMYAMLGTRPDLAHVVGVLGRHSARPDDSHWAAVVRVCQYLKGTLDCGIEYTPNDAPLAGFEAYSDSDRGACLDSSRSTMGYAFLLAGGAVSWSSRLQPRVAASSTEAKYLGLSHASKEAVFLSQLLGELGHSLSAPAVLFGDNQGANALSRDPMFHDRSRHLRLTEHFVREQVTQGVISVTYIPTARMVADAMTKSLPAPAFAQHRAGLGVRPLRARGGVAADAA